VVAGLAAGALMCGWLAPTATARSVTVAILPPTTTIDDLARIDGMSLGVMSDGIGETSATQMYLDIGQGNRVSPVLYSGSLPPPRQLRAFTEGHLKRVPGWPLLIERADAVPAQIVPGLLASTLQARGVPMRVERFVMDPALIAANREGTVNWLPPKYLVCRRTLCRGVVVLHETLHNTRKLIGRLQGDDLLIAIAAPPLGGERLVPVGVAGRGFGGELTSDSTRTDGYVLSTDVAPTILERFGLGIPDAMNGEPIRSEGTADAAQVDDLAARMAAIPDRREPILVVCILAWLLIAFAVKRIVFGLRRVAMAWLALCFAYMPLILLAGAWLEPGAIVEGLLVGLGSGLLAALTVRFAWGWRGPAIACAVTVSAYAIDVIAGSGLTKLSLLGPNPIFGVRFYGIGNELEALFAVMVPVGVGAGLSAWLGSGKSLNERGAILAFLSAGVIGALIFGAGRFGADVGAAIVLPVGAAVSAASISAIGSFEVFARHSTANASQPRKGSWRSLIAAAVLTPFIALFLLVLIDLASGGNSHLTRSVIDAGGASDLADLAQRRLELSAHDFAQAAGNPLFWIVVVGIVLGISQWRRIDAWLRPAPLARAGLIGACAALPVGVLANDSGATFLVLGGLALGAFLAFAWSQAGEISSSPRN
jgi:hypothetical protein